MTDKKDDPNTLRQRAYKERQREAGFKQQTLWIHSATEQAGKRAAKEGKPCDPVGSEHELSWVVGWAIERGWKTGKEALEMLDKS
ncbi:hypothetical protein [Pseudomonas syringae]|uniref:hypothetical protein n=1 Tax=Pseudomonas syringae TaxID=317 RepID=UPI000209725C|nr:MULTISPECIES: hypothetical protein [Pseudomonas syringae group]EGH97152.1 hypothetical protein PLA106_13707 [Pseudomonas amygdali pv. lachrymans str. M302278]